MTINRNQKQKKNLKKLSVRSSRYGDKQKNKSNKLIFFLMKENKIDKILENKL